MDRKTFIPRQMDAHNAFVKDGFANAPVIRQKGELLAGLALAVKDVFDVSGMRMGAGNPVWLEHSTPASHTATAVQLLLEQGALWVGKKVTDELTYSLSGMNRHYGAPKNPAAPGRMTGGSSSGSAAVVAAHYADIALGTDCGGSIRLPASYCGLWGFRPTFGRISNHGCMTLAHSFDTVGWFTRDWRTSLRVFEVLAHTQSRHQDRVRSFTVPLFVLALLDERIRTAFTHLLDRLQQHVRVSDCLHDSHEAEIRAAALRTLQAAEAWQQHGAWVDTHGASLGGDVRIRFNHAKQITREAVSRAQRERTKAGSTFNQLLDQPGTFLLMPTVSTVAPWIDSDAELVESIRRDAQKMLCLAGLAGLPQISFPWMTIDGAPIGLSIIGARGKDEAVYGAARYVQSEISAIF